MDYVRSDTSSLTMENDWLSQLPPSAHVPTASLQDSLESHNIDFYNRNTYSKLMSPSNPSTSENTRSIFQGSQSSASNGPHVPVWSSVESFPSSTSSGPTLEQYMTLSSQLNEVKQENSELIKHNRVLSAKLDTLAKAYEMLANRIPQILDSTGANQETREMNPNVKYWTRQEWIAANSDRVADLEEGVNIGARGRTRAAQGINVNMRYIEDRTGEPINGHLASDIRRHARAIFVGFANKGHLFTSWAEVDHNSLKVYYREMAQRFEELRLCSNDWKAEMVALDIYRTWRDQWQKTKQKQKKTGKNVKNDQLKDDCDDSDESDDGASSKHGIDHANSETERATKRTKSSIGIPDTNTAIPCYTVPAAETRQMLAIPNINIMPGTPVQVETGKTGFHYGSLPQPPVPSFQQTFDIVNPLRSSSNAASIVPPFTAMPPGAQPLPQAVSNVPMPIGLNPNPNIGYPAPLPPTAKSRRMRPTKSITARNLCAIDWCKQNKGTSEDFNKFWNGLPKDEKERYEALSKERSENDKAST